ncbi:NADPH oxidoreductase [Gordonia jinhuaensis]|uniref:NADPH oxidoreductase n=1 Tax=Gordonia jinhuaensis TaxID=1517702 RepID=A0A916T7G3_9ACTN|nr:ferredoxin reductase [Gordonia jinhuaensis]GGB34526.1 NADPH oxidoreductase [Gordonia jinhuaensis]
MNWLEKLELPARGVASRSRTSNVARGVIARLTTPLLPDDYLQLLNPLWSARELRGKVVEVVNETEDSATIVIEPGWGFTFDYQPGQYVGIGVLVDGRWTWRSYSLTSAPGADERTRGRQISITVKAMPEGFLSGHLVRGLTPGTIVRLAAPAGEFVLPEPIPAKLLFLTAGSGITPIISMLRTIEHRGQSADIVVVHSAPDAASALFGDELSAMTQSGLIDSHVQYTRESGRLDARTLTELVPDIAQRQVWACGPESFLSVVESYFGEIGAQDRLHIERFAVERGAVGAAGGTVTFKKAHREVEVDGATTLLEAGESVGVQLPFGCRMGICQTCVVTLDKGAVRDLRNGDEHVEGERIQTCISVAAGDCTLDV